MYAVLKKPADRRLGGKCGLLLALAVTTLVAGGCVRRRLTIRTDPPGALAYVDDYLIGTTPVTTNFTYYGPRKIRLVKDGYETQTRMQPIPAPWYQIPPLDFISENLVPGELTDRRCVTYQLAPQKVTLPEELLTRGESLRSQVQSPPPELPAPALSQPDGMGSAPIHTLPPSGM